MAGTGRVQRTHALLAGFGAPSSGRCRVQVTLYAEEKFTCLPRCWRGGPLNAVVRIALF